MIFKPIKQLRLPNWTQVNTILWENLFPCFLYVPNARTWPFLMLGLHSTLYHGQLILGRNSSFSSVQSFIKILNRPSWAFNFLPYLTLFSSQPFFTSLQFFIVPHEPHILDRISWSPDFKPQLTSLQFSTNPQVPLTLYLPYAPQFSNGPQKPTNPCDISPTSDLRLPYEQFFNGPQNSLKDYSVWWNMEVFCFM